MKNFEGNGEFLSYQTAKQFLAHIGRHIHEPLAYRDYCAVLLILEYGWRTTELLDKKVSDGLSIVDKKFPGADLLAKWCQGRNHSDYLFPGRNNQKMTSRNLQLRLLGWSESGNFRPVTVNMLVNTHRVRSLYYEFMLERLEWTI